MTIAAMQQKPDYKVGKLGKPYSKYVSVAKYAKRLNLLMVPTVLNSFVPACT